MSDYPMLISNKLHSFRNFRPQSYYLSTDFQRKLLLLIVLLAKIAIFACYFV